VTPTAWLLAWRSLSDRPWRSAVLLLGYGVGVAVMIALLSIGEALLAQAQDRDLVAGGDLVLLPEGVDPAVLKVNGVTGLFLTIPHASFLVERVLGGPRFSPEITAAAPEIHDRVVYLRVAGQIVPADASAGIPSLDRAAHVTQAVPDDTDQAADRAWRAPAPDALFDRIDHFHHATSLDRATWAEWDYFNYIDPATGAYGYITVLAGGEGKGGILLRVVGARGRGQPAPAPEDVVIPAELSPDGISAQAAAQRIGPAQIHVEAGRYHVTIDDPRAHVNVWLTPAPGFYLPPAESAGGGVVSGYVVPVVRGWVDGEIRTPRTTLRLVRAPAYHDHNWGTWRGVTWEWGEASGAGGALLYGSLHVAGDTLTATGGRPPALFLWAPTGSGQGGLVGVFPITSLAYLGWHPGPVVAGRRTRAPGEVLIAAGEEGAAVTVRIRVRDALGSVPVSGPPGTAGRAAPPIRVFLQLRGRAEVRGTVDGRTIEWGGPAAAETFVMAGK